MDAETTPNNAELNSVPSLKPGVKRPKNDSEWSTANKYFKLSLDLNQLITAKDFNSNIEMMNNTVYDYLETIYGYVDSHKDSVFVEKHKGFIFKQLKETLKTFKLSEGESLYRTID